MKRITAIVSFALIAAMMLCVLTACGGTKDAIAGTWKQTDEVNGDWVWEFDGSGKCTLDGITTGFKTEGTYVIDENAKTLTVTMDGWDDVKVYTYTLTDTTLDLDSTYSSYHLIKQ